MSEYSLSFPFAFGEPTATACFRSCPEDFVVDEVFDGSLSGEGEHFWLQIQKRGENTDWVAKKLANHFQVRKMDVGYGGKKDRHAVTTQWFSVYLPGKTHEIDWSAFLEMAKIDARLIAQGSHDRKLKIGHHEANRFVITLRDIEKTAELEARLSAIAERGVPNYFGPQRFGRGGGNLAKVEKWVEDPRGIRDRSLKGLIISSARSYLFNLVLAERLQQQNWLTALAGDPSEQPSGPLWGRGLSLASGSTLELESTCLASFSEWKSALENVGLKQERRSLCLNLKDYSHKWDNDRLVLAFTLGSGEYATSVLREIAHLNEPEREFGR